MPDVVTLLSQPLFLVTKPTATAVALLVDGIVIPESTFIRTSTVTELQQSSLNTGSAGKLFEHAWDIPVPYSISVATTLRAKLRWIVNNEGVPAMAADSCTARWSIMVKKKDINGAVQSLTYPPTETFGPTRNVGTGTTGTEYEEGNLTIDIPANAFTAGEKIRVILALYIVQSAAAAQLAVGLKCDPASPPNELVVEFFVGSP